MKYFIYIVFMFLVSAPAFGLTCFPAGGVYLIVKPGEANTILDIQMDSDVCEKVQFRYGRMSYLGNIDTIDYLFTAELELGAGFKTYTHESGVQFQYEVLVKDRSLEFTLRTDTPDQKCEAKGGFGYDTYDNPVDGSTFTLKYTLDCTYEDGASEVITEEYKMYRM